MGLHELRPTSRSLAQAACEPNGRQAGLFDASHWRHASGARRTWQVGGDCYFLFFTQIGGTAYPLKYMAKPINRNTATGVEGGTNVIPAAIILRDWIGYGGPVHKIDPVYKW